MLLAVSFLRHADDDSDQKQDESKENTQDDVEDEFFKVVCQVEEDKY